MSAFSGQRMAMPDRVRCIQCKTFKPLHAYSSKNQNELQDLLFRAPSNWQTNERHGLVPCAYVYPLLLATFIASSPIS